MSGCQTNFARIIQKRGNGLPTIPASDDHQNGDWLPTDIYEGEMYQDMDTGLWYTRNGSDITLADGSPPVDIYKAIISQENTDDPVIEQVLQNTLGITVSPTYISTGEYQLSGFAGNAVRVHEMTLTGLSGESSFGYNSFSTNQFFLRTYLSGTLSDDVLVYLPSGTTRRYCIMTITFY